MDEPAFTSTRTDAASYAESALTSLLQGVALDERQAGYVREMLESAFEDGERQGEFRALWILTIAQKRARGTDAQWAIRECISLLAPDIEGWELENESE